MEEPRIISPNQDPDNIVIGGTGSPLEQEREWQAFVGRVEQEVRTRRDAPTPLRIDGHLIGVRINGTKHVLPSEVVEELHKPEGEDK